MNFIIGSINYSEAGVDIDELLHAVLRVLLTPVYFLCLNSSWTIPLNEILRL